MLKNINRRIVTLTTTIHFFPFLSWPLKTSPQISHDGFIRSLLAISHIAFASLIKHYK